MPLLAVVPDEPYLARPALIDLEKIFKTKLLAGFGHRRQPHYSIKHTLMAATGESTTWMAPVAVMGGMGVGMVVMMMWRRLLLLLLVVAIVMSLVVVVVVMVALVLVLVVVLGLALSVVVDVAVAIC